MELNKDNNEIVDTKGFPREKMNSSMEQNLNSWNVTSLGDLSSKTSLGRRRVGGV